MTGSYGEESALFFDIANTTVIVTLSVSAVPERNLLVFLRRIREGHRNLRLLQF